MKFTTGILTKLSGTNTSVSNESSHFAKPIVSAHKISELTSPEVLSFIEKYISLGTDNTRIMETASRFNVETIEEGKLDFFVNLKRINDIRYLNKFFEAVNRKLTYGGIFIGCVETIEQRRNRIFRKYSPLMAIPYYSVDFIYKRIFPKLFLTKKIYFTLTQGYNRVLSKAETLGRLASCGFRILETADINGRLYFAVQSFEGPSFDEHPTYGPLVKLHRIGMNGKNIIVYKFRTMHPFAEYIQDYVYSLNNLETGGKFKDDFRITAWGKLLRKFWIDELPMLINFIKGDVKLIGVRPLSHHYFSLYPEEYRNRRIKYKPGLIPPYYADLPSTLPEIIDSEIKYLDAYDKNPYKTDIRYFFRAFVNIVIKRKHSR
ncbi:MAG: hypothetical protein Kow0098_29570 [Ignavibacteriaceae bacterium]